MSASQEFLIPTFGGTLDTEERVQGCPSHGLVKGMFFSAIAEEASRNGPLVGRERYVPFRGYALQEWLEFLPEAARAAHPRFHAKEGMRRFGHNAFGVFNKSTAGRVLLSMAGRNLSLAVSLSTRAFDVIGSHGRVRTLTNEPGRAVLALRDMWDYIDAWHVGIYEGALRAFGIDGEVRIRMHDLSNGDIELRY